MGKIKNNFQKLKKFQLQPLWHFSFENDVSWQFWVRSEDFLFLIFHSKGDQGIQQNYINGPPPKKKVQQMDHFATAKWYMVQTLDNPKDFL